MLVVGGFLENLHHTSRFGRIFKVIFEVVVAFQRKIHELFALVALGVVAFFIGQEPVAFLGGVGEEGHAQIRVECSDGVVEHKKCVAQEVVATFLWGVAIEAKVGVHLVGLSGHDSCEALPADVPEFVDGLVTDVFVCGSLGDHDEVVDDGVVGVGVFHVDSFGGFWAVFWAAKFSEKDDRTPFDSYQKAK